MAAYYNEFDPFAAAWLRELIKEGLIADGEVDERSIADVRADDLRGFTQCHFFAGIGGWSYALRLAGWPDDRPVWTGSCPCQPWSPAGLGTRTSDPRDLWPTWFKLIAQLTPPVVFGEQVASADGRAWIDRVYSNLEGADYAIGAANIPACSVGTPHIRYRLWFVADADERRCGWQAPSAPGINDQRDVAPSQQGWGPIARTAGAGLQPPWPPRPSEIGSIPIAPDGLLDIVEGRNAAGNAIVPQVAAAFIQAYDEAREGVTA